MNIKRSYFKLLMASAGVGLFLANCTVKTSSSDECEKGDKDTGCECPGGVTGYQVCNSQGVFGSCQCPGDDNTAGTSSTAGKSSNDGGTSDTTTAGKSSNNGGTGGYTAGTNAGGVDAVAGGAGGEGGASAGFPDYMEDCQACLADLCKTQFDACFDDPNCFSAEGDGSGEYEAISSCIEEARVDGLVKRDAVRGCGVTFGASPNPDLASDWAPQTMAVATTNLLNCLATSQSKPINADWANDLPTNFPNDVPAPWPADSCAKLACTSAK